MQIADYNPVFPTNFLRSLLNLERRLREELALESVFVLPKTAENRGWLADLREAGITLDFVDRSASHAVRIRTLRRIAEDSGAVILHTHFGTFDVDASSTALFLGCGSVWHMHSMYPIHSTALRRLGERIKFATARLLVDRIIAVSETVAQTAFSHGGPRSSISVVLNGIDTYRVRPVGTERRQSLRRQYGLPEDSTVFLLFANFPKRKGLDLLVQAAKRLAASSAAPVCVVVGGEDNLTELREMVSEAPSFHVLGPVPEISDLYGVADCFVSASRAEGLPYAVGEAMASCLPVIASDLPQVVRVYGPAGPGLVPFQAGSAEALAEAMDVVWRMPAEERWRAGQANAAFVESHLSLDRWSAGVLEVYRSILVSHGVTTGPPKSQPWQEG